MLKKELQKLLKEKEAENLMLWRVLKETGVKVEKKEHLSERYFGKIHRSYLFELGNQRYMASLLLDETNDNRF